MSDQFSSWPSPQSVERLGGAIQNLAFTIYGKVNQAEAHTQYMQGMELLHKRVTDFNNSLMTDQNPDGYMEKWDKSKEAIWREATALVKNQDALSAMGDQWANMDIRQYDSISGIQTQARINNSIDRAAQTTEQISGDNTIGNAERKAKVRQLWEGLRATGAINSQVLEKQLSAWDKKIDASAMEAGMIQIAGKEGWDYALGLADNPDFNKFFPSLTPGDRDAIASKVESRARFQEAQAQKEDQTQNAAYADQLDNAFENLQQGKKGGLTFDMIGDKQGFSGTVDGERYRRTFDSMLKTWVHEQKTGRTEDQKRNDINSTADAMDIITDTDLPFAAKKEKLREFGNERGVSINTVSGWMRQAHQTTNNPAFNSLLKQVSALGQGKNPIITKEQIATINGILTKEFENNPKITISKLEGEMEPLLNDAKKKNVQPLIDSLLSQQRWESGMEGYQRAGAAAQEGVATGEYVITAPQRKVPDDLSTFLSSRNLSVQKSGTDSRGTPYWQGSDGRYYIVSAGKILTLSEDGKAWVTP